jgi:hypothetical protein
MQDSQGDEMTMRAPDTSPLTHGIVLGQASRPASSTATLRERNSPRKKPTVITLVPREQAAKSVRSQSLAKRSTTARGHGCGSVGEEVSPTSVPDRQHLIPEGDAVRGWKLIMGEHRLLATVLTPPRLKQRSPEPRVVRLVELDLDFSPGCNR